MRSYAILLDPGQYLHLTIYGDPKNFSVLDSLVSNFHFELMPATSNPVEEMKKQFQHLRTSGLIDEAVESVMSNYVANDWTPTFLTKGDLNSDSHDDYVLYVEDKDNRHTSEFDPSYNAGRMRKLTILLSQPDGTYRTFDGKDLPFRMECGECGGVNDPMVSASISSSTLSIWERGGSPGAWWTLGAEILYQDVKWLKIKDISDNEEGY